MTESELKLAALDRYIAQLEAQNAELLAALETVLRAHDYDGALTTGDASLSPAIRGLIVRAIAKAKGGAA